jgi:predicted nucleotide-binding protein (sugar kinase/HSP70/actin superfamily)
VGLWEGFLTHLGYAVKISPPTTVQTVALAGEIAEAEHCLPVKLVHAHMAQLADSVDMLFVPRILSTMKGHMACPKLACLPDIARIELGGRTHILTIEFDGEKHPISRALRSLARRLGAGCLARRRAAKAALTEARPWRAEFLPTPKADSRRKILVLSHPYNLFDEHICGPIVKTLHRLNVDVELMTFDGEQIEPSFIKWDTSNEMYHRLRQLGEAEYAGVVQISSFNCGCDSVTLEFFRDVLTERHVPYMVLMIDEHTAQAGIETRLEAFTDSIGV